MPDADRFRHIRNPSFHFRTVLLAGVLALSARQAHAATGDVDTLDANIIGQYVSAIAVQPDGKMIIAGSFISVLGQTRNNIVRLNADGTLDTGFNPSPDGTYVGCVAVQPDGSILFAGDFTNIGGTARAYLARVAADGTLDASFDPDVNGTVSSMAVQPDGKILLGGGFTTVGGTGRNRIARINTNGTLDADFNPDVNDAVVSLVVQVDGRILLGGYFTSVGGTARKYIARVNANGTLDFNFNPIPSGGFGSVNCVTLQADGQILFGGHFTHVGGIARNYIARVDADGILDASFNPNANSTVYSAAVQADGQILIGGSFTSLGGTSRGGIARVAANGTLDASFNPNVKSVSNVAIQANGSILLGGSFGSIITNVPYFFARVLNDPATQVLSATDTSLVVWTRGGSAPEFVQTTFELSTNSGAAWTPLGNGTRLGATSNWQLTGLTLPASGQLRARGRTTVDGSSGLMEQIASFSGLVTPAVSITSILPISGSTLGGASVTITGTGFTDATSVTFDDTAATSFTVNSDTQITATTMAHAPGSISVKVTTPGGTNEATILYTYITPPTVTPSTASLVNNSISIIISGANFSPVPGKNTVTFTPSGTGTVTAATPASLTVTGLSGLELGAFYAVVTTGELNSGAAVQVATVVAPPPGTLDPFNANLGGGVGSSVSSFAVQPDGKTIIAGRFGGLLGLARNNIARLNADDTLDTGFNPNANSSIASVAVQADSQIVLGGSFTAVGGGGRNYIARLNASGALDTTFNPNANNSVTSLVVQPDGKILIGGNFTAVGATGRNRIARLNANGTLDTGFNPNANNTVTHVALQADGKILLGGTFTMVGGVTRNRAARLNSDGTLDADFNPDVNGTVSNMVVQANGQILIGGTFTTVGGTGRNFIARLGTDGILDDTFNPGADGSVSTMALQADGQIVLGGSFTWVGGAARSRIARLATSGLADASFNPNANNSVYSVALRGDGRVLLGGIFTTIGGTLRNLFARLANDPATQSLSAVDSTRVLWTRGGSAPDVTQTRFELSTDGGNIYTPLGATANRVGVTPNWQLTGLSLPISGQLRARGLTNGNRSWGLIEQVIAFNRDTDDDALLDTWEELHWPGATVLHGPLDDDDHDGLVNLLELAFGLNPTLPDVGGLPPVTQEGGYLTMTITKQPGAAYEVQSAGTLTPGQPDSFSATTTTVLLDDATTLKVRDNTLTGTATARFMRVQVTGAP